MIFWSIAILLFAQMTWWITFQVRESRRLMGAQIEKMRAGRAEAWQMDTLEILGGSTRSQSSTSQDPKDDIVAMEPKFRSLYERRRRIENRFPYVAVVPSPIDFDDPMLFDSQGTLYLTLRRDTLTQMERDRRMELWRLAVQVVVMVGVVFLGMAYIYVRLNVEMELMLRQRNFIAAVTHELKTPVASLRVWIETLFTRTLSAERKARIQTLMDGDLTRLTEMLGNLLDVARADAGRLEVMPEPVELGPWLRGVCEGMDHRLGQGMLGLQLELAEGVRASIDPRLFATVVENLLSNAYKYASEPRQTTVALEVSGDNAVISVSDHGIGLHPREIPKLFQRFYRVGDEMTRQVGGTGLGLFLCREIVTNHHGNIHVSSEGTGLGTTFVVRIPRLPR
jgi:two-component system sensor histidine kinase CiaH